MRRRIVLVGHSPVAFFIAAQLNQKFGPHVNNHLIWLSGSSGLANIALGTTVVGRWPTLKPKALLEHVRLSTQPVKRISLAEEYLVLPNQVLKYDYLILDGSSQYQPEELEQFGRAVEQLFIQVKARAHLKRPARARVVIEGSDAGSYQLASLVYADANQFGLTADDIRVEVKKPDDERLRVFLSGQGLVFQPSAALEQLTTLRLQAPQPLIKTSTVRGLQLDRFNEGKVLADHRVRDYPHVWYIGARSQQAVNLWRPAERLANEVVRSVTNHLFENSSPHLIPTKQPAAAMLLTGSTENYLEYDGLGRGVATRQLVRWGEYRLYRKLSGRSNSR